MDFLEAFKTHLFFLSRHVTGCLCQDEWCESQIGCRPCKFDRWKQTLYKDTLEEVPRL